VQSAKPQVKRVVSTNRQAQGLHTAADTRSTDADRELAAAVIASRATTQPIETVTAVLAHVAEARRSTLPPKRRGSTIGPLSGLLRLRRSGGRLTSSPPAEARP
jgi:hypothetical protein